MKRYLKKKQKKKNTNKTKQTEQPQKKHKTTKKTKHPPPQKTPKTKKKKKTHTNTTTLPFPQGLYKKMPQKEKQFQSPREKKTEHRQGVSLLADGSWPMLGKETSKRPQRKTVTKRKKGGNGIQKDPVRSGS